MIVWLELVAVLMVASLAWVAVLHALLWVGAELVVVLARTRPAPPQFYADARRDHPAGEEGPSPYPRAPTAPTAGHAADVGHLLTQMAKDDAKRAAQERAVQRAHARPRKILRKRDGMSLTDEASAAVYRSVFGNDPPA